MTGFFVEAKRSGIELGGFYFQFVLDPDVKTVDQPCEDGSCSAGYSFAGVTHDGYVYLCSHLWQLAEDNVRQRRFPGYERTPGCSTSSGASGGRT